MGLPVVEALKAELTDQPQNPLRPYQIREYEDEMVQLGAQAQGRDQDNVPRDWLQGAKGASLRRRRQIQGLLNDQAPKPLTGERANRVHAKLRDVEDVIRGGLLPRSTMRRNPPGAVGHVLRTEFAPAFKDAVLTWKRARLALDPRNDDPDYTNAETLRSEGPGDGTATFMAGAQIPGHVAMSPQAKANWPLGEPTADTALQQARRRDDAADRPEKRKPTPPPMPVYRCDHDGCDFSRKGGFGRMAVEKHKAKAHGVMAGATPQGVAAG